MNYQILKKLRKSFGKTSDELASYLNVSHSTYQKYECGKRGLSIEKICKLSDYYNVSTDYLLGRTINKVEFDSENIQELKSNIKEALEILNSLARNLTNFKQ